MQAKLFKQVIIPTILLAPSAAFAHNGEHAISGFVSGVLHPLAGLDHLLALLAVGIVAARQSGKARLAIPTAFLAFLLVGATAGVAGMVAPQVEAGILASLMILGLMISASTTLSATISTVLISIFALLHGQAHGAEIPAGASTFSYFSGFLLASLLIQSGALICSAKMSEHNATLVNRIAGAGILVSGLTLASI